LFHPIIGAFLERTSWWTEIFSWRLEISSEDMSVFEVSDQQSEHVPKNCCSKGWCFAVCCSKGFVFEHSIYCNKPIGTKLAEH